MMVNIELLAEFMEKNIEEPFGLFYMETQFAAKMIALKRKPELTEEIEEVFNAMSCDIDMNETIAAYIDKIIYAAERQKKIKEENNNG